MNLKVHCKIGLSGKYREKSHTVGSRALVLNLFWLALGGTLFTRKFFATHQKLEIFENYI